MAIDISSMTAVVMAKRPEPGMVKSRLVTADGYDETAAAQIAAAMLACTLERLGERMHVVLAVTPSGCGPPLLDDLGVSGVESVDQGPGDLGSRLDRVWHQVGGRGAVAFFGMDSPDVPDESLLAIPDALRVADLAVGPTDDGGYWTLSGRTPQPSVLRRIDWGTASVYDQTVAAAKVAGLSLHELPPWTDVDVPSDVAALRHRLAPRAGNAGRPLGRPLERLARRLDVIGNRTASTD